MKKLLFKIKKTILKLIFTKRESNLIKISLDKYSDYLWSLDVEDNFRIDDKNSIFNLKQYFKLKKYKINPDNYIVEGKII